MTCKKILPNGLPRPDRMPLPDLSPALTCALNEGHKTSDIFNQVLKECEIFYTVKFPSMADSAYYQAIGKKMIQKFPCLAFADGTNPWVSISKFNVNIIVISFHAGISGIHIPCVNVNHEFNVIK